MDNYKKAKIAVGAIIGAQILVYSAVTGTVIYVVAHFIRKVW